MTVEDLIVRHIGWLRNKARRYYADEFDADDLAGDTIYKCLSHARHFDSARSFKPWALTIMENTYKTLYNRKKCVMFAGYDEQIQSEGSEYADQQSLIHNLLWIIRDCGRRSRCIECVLLYAKGYSYDEIADMIGIPCGTVKSRIASGRKMLRQAMF